MDNISLKGENYIKSSKIAAELGYTTDYVGQLCRGGLVAATLVGRTWYVSEKSIKEHKKNRYRSNQAKSFTAIRKLVEDHKDKRSDNLMNRTVSVAAYEEDSEPLLPRIEKVVQKIAYYENESVSEELEESSVSVKIRKPEPKIHYTGRVSEIRVSPPEPVIPRATPVTLHHKEIDSQRHSDFYNEKQTIFVSVTVISSAVVAIGFVMMMVFVGMEQRFFASRVLPPETYYHFDLMGGVYAAIEAGKDI